MALHPVGPLAAGTYWRRRAVIGGALLLLLVLLKACTGSSQTGKDAVALAHPTTSPTPARTVTATPTPLSPPAVTATGLATPTARVTAGSTGSPSAGPVVSCPDSVLVLIASADAPSYASGSTPGLRLSIRNGGPVACRRNVGSRAVELRILSGSDRIWSSDDCANGGSLEPVLLQPGETRSTSVVWSGRRSQPGCGGSTAQAQPGTYLVFARVGTLTRGGGSFALTAG